MPAASRRELCSRSRRSRSLTTSLPSEAARKGSRPLKDMHTETRCSVSPSWSTNRATMTVSEALASCASCGLYSTPLTTGVSVTIEENA